MHVHGIFGDFQLVGYFHYGIFNIKDAFFFQADDNFFVFVDGSDFRVVHDFREDLGYGFGDELVHILGEAFDHVGRVLVLGGHGQEGGYKLAKADIGIEIKAKQADNSVLLADNRDRGGFDGDPVLVMVKIGQCFLFPASFNIFQHF